MKYIYVSKHDSHRCRLSKQYLNLVDTTYTQQYNYDSYGRVSSMAVGNGDTISLTYNSLSTVTTVSTPAYDRTYGYFYQSSDFSFIPLVQTLGYTTADDSTLTWTYSYDSRGNIEQVIDPISGQTIAYEYDDLGQLVKETAGTTVREYIYDSYGNIREANGVTYTYGDGAWRDLLTAYNGQTISYDGSGNPTSYYNGTRWTFAWENGRELASASKTGTSISFKYDGDGIRTEKKVGNTTYQYIYASGKLIRQTWGTNKQDFLYDQNGSPYAMIYNGTPYYYITNLQGDVVRLVDATGAIQATYTYDAWGKVLSATGSMANINPLRYRGYYYDAELEMYYLQSRYYDPQIGRFLNPDTVYDYDAGFPGYNLFVYCGDNPVNRIDISGTDSRSLMDGDKEEEHTDEGGGDGKLNPTLTPPTQVSGNTGNKITATGSSNIPQEAYDTLNYVNTHNGHPPNGHKGGKIFNNDGRDGGDLLPNNGTIYREYDIYPHRKGQLRGRERIVVGSNGAVWYTFDHYGSFIRMV